MRPRHGRTSRTGRPRLAWVLATLLLLAGCAPSFGSDPTVRPGLEVRGGEGQLVRPVLPGPRAGANQADILRGFIAAGASSDGDFQTAREFLTPDAAKTWVPDGEVVVYSTSTPLSVTATADNAARLVSSVTATIDHQGRYTSAASATTRRMDVEFARISGQWRISRLPEDFGRWITTSDVPGNFRPYNLYYIATDRRALVPDRRWFARDHLATRLARAQLAVPPAYLRGAARNDIPVGSRLTADSVSVAEGVAQVNITGPVPTDQTQRENVWAQLVSTLTQDPSIQGIRIRVGDVSLELPNVSPPVRTVDDVGFPAAPSPPSAPSVVRRGAQLFVLPSTGVADQDPRPSGLADVQADFRALALSADGNEVAAVDPDGQGVSRYRGENRYAMGFFGTDVGHPTYDTRGYLWVGGIGIEERASSRLWFFDTRADPAAAEPVTAWPIEAGWLAKRRVVQAKPSLTGDRVAVLSTAVGGGDARIDIAGVQRGDAGIPNRLSEPMRLGTNLRNPTGLVWLSNLTLATLAQKAGSNEKRRPYVLSIDGEEQALTETPTATSITSAGGERDIVVTTSAGAVLGRAGQQWLSIGPGTDVAVPAR